MFSFASLRKNCLLMFISFQDRNISEIFLSFRFWKNPKKMKGWKGRQFSWRDLFEVALKWRKLVSMDQPVIWLDQLPKQIVDAGFVTHMVMKKGYIDMPRYSTYTAEALQLAKFMIRSLLGQKLPPKAQDQIMKAVSPSDILTILRKYDSTNPSGGIVLTYITYIVYTRACSSLYWRTSK